MPEAWVTGRFHAEARNPLNNKKRNKNSSIIVTNANSISKPVWKYRESILVPPDINLNTKKISRSVQSLPFP